LFSEKRSRAALADEPEPGRPEVATIVTAFALARDAEWLAGARACPNRSVHGPPGEAQCEGPATDAGEEVTGSVAANVSGLDIGDAPLVNVADGKVPGADEFP
jgi:hypothetical protein